MKQLVVTGPERILESLQSLIEAIWESDHKYERLDDLSTKIIEVEVERGEHGKQDDEQHPYDLEWQHKNAPK